MRDLKCGATTYDAFKLRVSRICSTSFCAYFSHSCTQGGRRYITRHTRKLTIRDKSKHLKTFMRKNADSTYRLSKENTVVLVGGPS